MELSPGLRAGLDQEMTATLTNIAATAAAYDGRDLPDAVIALAARWLAEMTEEELADVAALLALTVHRQQPAPPAPKMSCPRCGSPRWVAVSLNEGWTRRRQCVPCGTIWPGLIKDDKVN